jgi:hypothetical protein
VTHRNELRPRAITMAINRAMMSTSSPDIIFAPVARVLGNIRHNTRIGAIYR